MPNHRITRRRSLPAFRRQALAAGAAALLVAGLNAGVLSAAKAAGAAEPKLTSHRAAYEITLYQSREGVGPTAARGLMAYEFTDACERWVAESRIVLDVLYGEETPVRTDWNFTSWEAKDGRDYGFNMTHRRNERLEEDLKGTARLDPGKGGEAAFTGDVAKQMSLPKDTLFPTAHLIASLKAAVAGQKVFSRPLFDGGSLDNPYDTNVYIVHPKDRDDKTQALLKKAGFAAGLPVWRHQAAFFSMKSGESTPVFELEVDYRADGVAERIIQSFGDFAIRMTPVKMERIKGGC